jgi:hypothetical protein
MRNIVVSLATLGLMLSAGLAVACDDENDEPGEVIETVEEGIDEGAQTAEDAIDDIGEDDENTPEATETQGPDEGE